MEDEDDANDMVGFNNVAKKQDNKKCKTVWIIVALIAIGLAIFFAVFFSAKTTEGDREILL